MKSVQWVEYQQPIVGRIHEKVALWVWNEKNKSNGCWNWWW